MLDNDSIDDVRDYVGQNQIGNLSFTKADDLITTRDIIQKAKNDLDFQIALYNLLEKESQNIKDNSDMLKQAIENSNNIGLRDIDCKINNEYEIDRSELVSKIKTENHKNISIQGGAGSGKSVLCKIIVEGEVSIVYARAERFQEETDINSIWGFNIMQTLKYLEGKPFVFFIDSLEFIADIPTKLDLLRVLYGGYHLKEIVYTIRKLHINKLLPEILLSLRDALENTRNSDAAKQKYRLFEEAMQEIKTSVIVIMTKAFLDFSDHIKKDDDLTKAFEEILEILVELRCEEAATILDEFRVH